MKQLFTLLIAVFTFLGLQAQSASVSGTLNDDSGTPIEFVNVVLYAAADSALVKVETTNELGTFKVAGIEAGDYWLEASYVGLDDLKQDISLKIGEQLAMGTLVMPTASVELDEAVVTAQRALVEIKPDRTVFNVEGTINSVGDDAFNLLRKAPGVLVDNNDNITVLGRAGVMVYVDGKRLPLSGDELANYLKNIPAEQIDRFDIITNPGAKYEAEGTAGIIDIRMKRDKSLGSNGSLSSTYSQGRYGRGNVSGLINYRNSTFSSFGQAGYGGGSNFQDMRFNSTQNGFATQERIRMNNANENINYRLGTDFFIKENHTLGFLVSGNNGTREGNSFNRVEIGSEGVSGIDSILFGRNLTDANNDANTFNLNYVFNKKGTSLNIDADYGTYRNNSATDQPNQYLNPTEETVFSEVNTNYNTENDIDIYTFLVDYEKEAFGGTFGLGTKLSNVQTVNTFLFYDIIDQTDIFNEQRSNIFEYDETVYAGYVNYARGLGEKTNISIGLRLEHTDIVGDLRAFDPTLNEPKVENDYLSAFPSAGITYQLAQEHTLSLNYGRRINRPDYNVLNPFRAQVSELSYFKGNPFLNPEIVNNYEVGYTLKYRYNFKLSYSKTTDQITRLISPDDQNPLAGFLTWDNLAVQHIYALNISAPVDISEKWSAFFNLSGSRIDNQADYGDGGMVDIQAWTYNIYQQHTFKLPGKFTAEVSGWFSGPGVWGGVFLYDESWSLNLGLQRRFLEDQLNVKLSFNDIFYETGWSGTSLFNGLNSTGRGQWDSRRASLSVSMNFGNKNVKSRKRSTGLEQEASRVKNE